MEKEKLKKLHSNLLDLLKNLDSICSKNNINYSLFGGTLIGAIRHKGFIPWDDDADVIMERAEYDKLLRVLPSGFEIVRNPWVPRFKSKNNKLFIDLFILDYTSNNKEQQKWHILKLKFLQGTMKTSLNLKKGDFISKALTIITFLIGLPFSKKHKLKIHDLIATKFNPQKTNFLLSTQDQYRYIHNVLPSNIINSYSKKPFEDTKLMVMEGHHTYLKMFHGDYMQLPPEHLRKPQHGNV